MDYQIFNENCLEGMKRIADNSVDMILADLPYGITDCPFDVRIPFEPMWEQFKRVTKRNATIVLFSQMPFGSDLIQSNRKMFRYEIIWEKNCGVNFLNAKKMPLRKHENILVFYQRLPTYNPQFTQGKPCHRRRNHKTMTYAYNPNNGKGWYDTVYENKDGKRYPSDVVSFKLPNNGGVGDRSHCNQKPVDLLEYLIRTYSNEDELILDATMGSGSTGVAAINQNRRFIGFETEQKFYEIARKRIDEAIAKREQSLFKSEVAV